MNPSSMTAQRRRFYRDPERGVILGVCAGLADYFELPVWAARITALVCLWFFPAPAVAGYLVAALLMPTKPLRFYGHGGEKTFWRMHSRRG